MSKNIHDINYEYLEQIQKNPTFPWAQQFLSYANQSIIFNKILKDICGKDVLALGTGSGDYYFNSILYGAKNVVLFDADRLNYFGTLLKSEIIRNCEFSEFTNFALGPGLYNSDTFYKVSGNLPFSVCDVFNYIFEERLFKKFFPPYDSNGQTMASMHNPYYETKENYQKLQQILPAEEPRFICCDVRNLKPDSQKYDCIILSNLACFVPMNELIRSVSGLLKSGGQILAFIDNTANALKHINVTFNLHSKNFKGFKENWYSFLPGASTTECIEMKEYPSLAQLSCDVANPWHRREFALLLTRGK